MQITFLHIIRFESQSGECPGVTHHDLRSLERMLMAKVIDLINQAQAEADAAVARVVEDVATLDAKIADLQAKVDSGEASPEVEAALQKLIDTQKALDPKQPDTLPEEPTPEPTPTP